MEHKILELLQSMHNQMTSMQSDITSIKYEQLKVNERLSNLEAKVDKGFADVNSKIDNLSCELGEMISKEVGDTISNQLQELKSDVKFLTYKVQDTEKDVFGIKDHLKLIK